MKSLLGILSLSMIFSSALGNVVTQLHEEELVSDIYLDAKEFIHFHLKVTS